MNSRVGSSVRLPSASNLLCAWPIITSGRFTGIALRNISIWRRWYCARAEPKRPGLAPMMATGLPSNGWFGGREARSADVVVVERQVADLGALDRHALGGEPPGGAQGRGVERALPQAARN